MEADISAQSDFMRLKKLTALKETRQAYHEILTANDCLTLKDLKINGNISFHHIKKIRKKIDTDSVNNLPYMLTSCT